MAFQRLRRIDLGGMVVIYEGGSIKNEAALHEAENKCLCEKLSVAEKLGYLFKCISLDPIRSVKMLEIRDYKLRKTERSILVGILKHSKCANIRKVKLINVYDVVYTQNNILKEVQTLDIDFDEDYSPPAPSCLSCLDLWAAIVALFGAVLAIINYNWKFVEFETFSLCFQVIGAFLFALSPFRNVFCNCSESESAVMFVPKQNVDQSTSV
ncbi:uncharacterized protein LOC116348717 [Contarinia nasturtii]|uniref:uncharacterized protein LOC116348717 n=1 Tax=Contarinia nasturtii TaxID=265458 RepID=UPI0012D41FEA|nr:uncharacterized protein LOC116348717 [Contarinia nasturtii]